MDMDMFMTMPAAPRSSSDRKRKGRGREIREEDILKYVTRKAQKEALKVAKKLKSGLVSGYSNDSNPFGDRKLTERFVWMKKIEREVVRGRDVEVSVEAERRKMRERVAEIERVKRREERALERAQREEELAMLARERVKAEFRDCEKEEEEEMARDVYDAREVHSLEPIVEERERSDDEEAGSFSFSPVLICGGGDEEEAIDPEEDKAELDRKREAVAAVRQRRITVPSAPDDMERKAMKAMGAMEEGEAVFGSGAEVHLDSSQVYKWHDKYRPRKPKYFNRFHTGYEWNRYNQTHYDHDNPPPKTVQGYKFNIFYPDLVDMSKAPSYTIEEDAGNGETCLIRFHAGAPYEDVAFRIVNKEWEYSKKKGFKCTFDGGILQLYFNFKRYRYRR